MAPQTMRTPRWHLGLSAVAMLALPAVVPAQERLLTSGNKAHLDAAFSPDGRWVAYQAKGSLWLVPSSGGSEAKVYDNGQPMTYLWERNSASFVILALDKLLQVSRDGQTKRVVHDLKGKGVQDIYFLTPDGVWCYGVRTVLQPNRTSIVFRVRLSDGKYEDLPISIPGVTSLDVDRAQKKLLISATVFLFTYNFFEADIDGKNLRLITSTALSTPADHGRWLSGTTTLVFEHTGQVGTMGSGFQVWTMDAANANHRPITWLPRQRKAVPELSPDGKWIATLEFSPSTNTARALVLPADGGGEAVLSVSLFQAGNRIRWSPSGASVVYVGATQVSKPPDVRVYDLDRPLRLAPTARPGVQGTVTLELTRAEAGLVFLGFGLAQTGLQIPGLDGTLDLDLASGFLLLYVQSFQNLTGPWITPNDTALIGKTVYLQALRLLVGQGLKGAFLPATHVDIAPL